VSRQLPRVLFVGRNRYTMPLPEWLAKKWDAVERQLEYRVLASARERDQPLEAERFRLLRPIRPRFLDGALFYVRAPLAVRRQIREFRPDVIVAESPYTGAAALIGRTLAGAPRPRVVLEVHGDWRTATRLYGSPRRHLLSPIADGISRAVVRRTDAVRALSPYTEGLVEEVRGVPVTASFPTYTDLTAFTAKPVRPLPDRPTAAFVAMLEPYKNVDGLADAWELVLQRVPEARLVVVGDGSRREVVERLLAEYPESVEWHPQLPPADVAARLDDATVLVLPSRSEGLGRVIIEAFARGRGVVASGVGGIPDLVRHEVEGLLVDPTDTDGIADAFVRVLADRELAERLGEAARERYAEWHTTPGEYASRMRTLVEASLREVGAVPGERRRVLVVGAQARNPSDAALAALRHEVDYCVLGRADRGSRSRSAAPAPGSVHLAARLGFWPFLPFRVRALVRRFRPQVVIAETPRIGFLVLAAFLFRRRGRPSLVIETDADWRSTARAGGSRGGRLLAPIGDWAARYALRRADGIHALSRFTAELAEREAGVAPLDAFPAYIDLSIFTARPPTPLPTTPTALYVGMLEANKNVDGLARAWRLAADELPDARLVIVGQGALIDIVERLRDDYPDRVEHHSELTPAEVAEQMDASTCIVLPSRSEGLGRVIIEAFARGRGAVASRVGGIPDIVRDGEDGILVDPADHEELGRALVRVLSEPGLAERLGAAAKEHYRDWHSTPDEYASLVRSLVEKTLAGAAR
jgi:glycosyltransferase involved in cell wall biosynthesis